MKRQRRKKKSRVTGLRIATLALIALVTYLWQYTMNFGPDPEPTPVSVTSSTGMKNGLRVIFMDVGQGASQLLIGPTGKTMLIDAGNNDKEELMLKYLRHYGVKRLDIVIGTHPDADHIGGLDKVIDHLDIGKVYMPKARSNTETFASVLRSVANKGLKVTTAKSGVELNWEPNVQVKLLAPIRQYDDNNNMSAVMKVTYGKNSFLLTGDAERESEQDILASRANLKSDVLLVGHHGSRSSTTAKFLSAVNPRIAVIQVGKDNKYGHPTKTTLDRLKNQGIDIYRNDLQGTVEIDSNGTKLNVHLER